MQATPRTRRLENDYRALTQLRADSTIFDFEITQRSPQDLVEGYKLRFYGKGIWRADGTGAVLSREYHEVSVRLGAAYPRLMPDLAWKTPIYHPNVSFGGVVCLGGYGKFWVPSLSLDELCTMLWDMIRYKNFDVASPYNREAASWAMGQRQYSFPVDARPIRDRVAGYQPRRPVPPVVAAPIPQTPFAPQPTPVRDEQEAEIVFLD